jgi:phosphoglucosamine mutase
MGALFGTDGIRGKANVHPMTADVALAVGRAVGSLVRRPDRPPSVVIGRDTRLSGDMIEAALTAGLCSTGADVLSAGVIPTPGVAFLIRDTKSAAGIVVSASHNPFDDNGIKVFDRAGQKLPDAQEDFIEGVVEGRERVAIEPAAIGRKTALNDACERYAAFCKRAFDAGASLQGLRLVLDCGNGATHAVAPAVFTGLGAGVTVLNDAPDGTNINRDCGSQHVAALISAVKRENADAGLAFDGDGDRLIAVDETGRELDGDAIMAVCARDLLDRGLLANQTVVVTPMSNLGLRLAFERLGIRCLDAAVGDRHVRELMQKAGAVLGGEQSGHIIFLQHHSTGDGIISALRLLSAMRRRGERLSVLGSIFQPAPQKLINVEVARKPPLDSVPDIQSAIAAATVELAGRGRVLVRYSGTQMLCRVMVEAPDPAKTDRIAGELAALVRANLG